MFWLPVLIAASTLRLSSRSRSSPEAGCGPVAVGASTADRQRLRFKADPGNAGSPCGVGLWRYKRWPTNIFEVLIWVGCALVAAGSPRGRTAFACPDVYGRAAALRRTAETAQFLLN